MRKMTIDAPKHCCLCPLWDYDSDMGYSICTISRGPSPVNGRPSECTALDVDVEQLMTDALMLAMHIRCELPSHLDSRDILEAAERIIEATKENKNG